MDNNTKLMVKQAHQVYLAHKLLEKTASPVTRMAKLKFLAHNGLLAGLQGVLPGAVLGGIGGALTKRDNETMGMSVMHGARKGALAVGLGSMLGASAPYLIPGKTRIKLDQVLDPSVTHIPIGGIKGLAGTIGRGALGAGVGVWGGLKLNKAIDSYENA